MKTMLFSVPLAACALTRVALADRAPAAPDFQAATPRAVDRALAASDGTGTLDPLDVIPFAFDSAKLDDVDRIELREAAHWIAAHSGYHLVIAGHTDVAGSDPYNVGLAARRARAVADQVIQFGAPPSRVVLAIYGKANPPSRAPYAAANRIVLLYATTSSPRVIAKTALPIATAVLWAEPPPAHAARSTGDLDMKSIVATARGETARQL